MSDEKRDLLVWEAKFAEKAERYDKMLEVMKKVLKLGTELTTEERQLFSVASKNTIGRHRNTWRIIAAMEEQEVETGNEGHISLILEYRTREEMQIINHSNEIIDLLEKHLLKNATNTLEYQVFCYKLKADHYRFIAEVASSPKVQMQAVEEGLIAYQTGTTTANNELDATNSTRLSLALNFAVFYYEILGEIERAINIAKHAISDAITRLDTMDEHSAVYQEATAIVQLLLDNMNLWSSELNENENEN